MAVLENKNIVGGKKDNVKSLYERGVYMWVEEINITVNKFNDTAKFRIGKFYFNYLLATIKTNE